MRACVDYFCYRAVLCASDQMNNNGDHVAMNNDDDLDLACS